MDNKQLICDLLCATLKATRRYCNLQEIVFRIMNGEEIVTLVYCNGNRKSVNITGKDGGEMINDIMGAAG